MPKNVPFLCCNSSKIGHKPAASDGYNIVIRDLLPAATLLLAGLAGLLVASLSGSGRNGQYLVIAAPWSNLAQTINVIGSAQGGVVEAGRFRNVVIAASLRTDFADRARNAGAWLVVPSPRTVGCLGTRREVSPK